jgi:hypothetical protein
MLRSRNAPERIRVLDGRRAGRRLGLEIKVYRAHPAAETWRGTVFVGLTKGWTNRSGSVFGVELWIEMLGHLMGGRQTGLRCRRLGADG